MVILPRSVLVPDRGRCAKSSIATGPHLITTFMSISGTITDLNLQRGPAFVWASIPRAPRTPSFRRGSALFGRKKDLPGAVSFPDGSESWQNRGPSSDQYDSRRREQICSRTLSKAYAFLIDAACMWVGHFHKNGDGPERIRGRQRKA